MTKISAKNNQESSEISPEFEHKLIKGYLICWLKNEETKGIF
jgi:hypothetical protein